MHWISFFVGMGAMVLLTVVVFCLIPRRKNSEPDPQMQILHEFWRENIRISQATQTIFLSMAESLERIEGNHTAMLKTFIGQKADERFV